MTRAARFEDIKNRYDLALAERNFTQPGTENYNILSEVARSILAEYQTAGKPKSQRVRNGFTVKEEKPKGRLEKATENFVAVRDHFLNEDRDTSRAFRLAWKKPMKFYHEHTPAEAVEILKREAEENVQ